MHNQVIRSIFKEGSNEGCGFEDSHVTGVGEDAAARRGLREAAFTVGSGFVHTPAHFLAAQK